MTSREELIALFDLHTGKQIYPTIIAAGLDAVLPLIEADVRDRLAKEIEANATEKRSTMWQTEVPGLTLAAHIVRGGDR